MFLFIIVKANELKTSHLQRESERLMRGGGGGMGGGKGKRGNNTVF